MAYLLGGSRPRLSAGRGARPRGPRVGRKRKKKTPPSRRRGGLAVAGVAPATGARGLVLSVAIVRERLTQKGLRGQMARVRV